MVDLNSIMPIRREQVHARFVCKFCHRTFVNEDKYMQHECKQMKRDAELKSPVGQAAWGYYQTWMRQLKRMPPPAAAFLTSKYFRTFINFTNFIRSVDLPRPEKFIQYMVEKNFTPTMWMSDEVYTLYLEFLDRRVPPMEHVKMSIDTLLNLSDKYNTDVSVIFDHIEPYEMMHWLRVRKISPWLLLLSKKFKLWFVNNTNDEQKIILESLIRPEYWSHKFESNPEDITSIKKCISALDI